MKQTGYSGRPLEGFLDKRVLTQMQDRFCSVANIYSFVMDDRGCMLTEMSGNAADVRILYDGLGQDAFFHVYDRVAGDSLEDQVVEDTRYENVKLAAFRVVVSAEITVIWIVCAVFDEGSGEEEAGKRLLTGVSRHIRRENLEDALDLMRLTASRMLGTKNTLANTEAERVKTASDNENMSSLLKHAEAMTGIVQLLGSDEPIENIFGQVLRIAGEYLSLSGAQVFQLGEDQKTMGPIAQWCDGKNGVPLEKEQELSCLALYRHERTNVISSDSVCSPEEKELMEQAHIRALVTFPMLINGRLSMCAAFDERGRERRWTVEEIRFLNDTVQVMQNILLKRIQKNSVVSSYQSLVAILDHVGCAICLRDKKDGRILFVNQIWKSTFNRETGAGIRVALAGAGEDGQRDNVEFHDEENDRFYDLYTTEITWVDGRRALVIAAYDITVKKVYQKKIEHLAYTDYLTGLYNRMCCERDLAAEIERARRQKRRGALFYVDLDDFKKVNDGLGHEYGDELLKEIAQSFMQIEGLEESCYRMGGDEFAIIVPVPVYPRLEMILDRIRERFSKPWFLKDSDYYCTMSVGVATFPDEGEDVSELIRKADIAMYEAKRGGKNRVARYTSGMASVSGRQLDMERSMHSAAAQGCGEFEIYYQPIVDAGRQGTPCIGAEALLRWNSKELGFLLPSDFIPLAEYLGLIGPIGDYVLAQACGTLREWNEGKYPDYQIAVNLSVIQLLQDGMAESVERIVEEAGIDPHHLTLEVTERLAVSDMDRMKKILGRLRALGVRIALDDFGTGYSSLNHIREMPLDVVKIDHAFVKELDRDSYAQSFVRTVSELAGSVGVSVCVEGIENAGQLAVLEGMKVQMMQGYYFGKPMPKEQFNREFAPGPGKEQDGR